MKNLKIFLCALVLALGFTAIVYATVTPVAPPTPPQSNLNRACYVWGGGDELGTDTKQNSLLSFCNAQGVNVAFLDIWRYLGGANWTTANQTNVQKFVDAAHKSGIQVFALAGNTDWGQNQAWVLKNIVQPLIKYQAIPSTTYPNWKFDGIIYDVEYWTDAVNYPAATNCPGLCELIRHTKSYTDLPVGCFAGFYLKDSTATRATITYNGKAAQDGEHLMDAADFISIGSYRNHAADNGTDGPGQITLSQPWFTYATGNGKSCGLYVGSETQNITPAYTTYYGMTKTAMEGQHQLVTNQFQVTTNPIFMGVAVDDYTNWKAMSP